jgi:hypothetical protein
VEQRVVEVGFGADLVERAAIPGANAFDEVFAKVGAFFVLAVVVQEDLRLSVSRPSMDRIRLTCTNTPR